MATNTAGTTARTNTTSQQDQISILVNFNTTGIATGVNVGIIPAGSVIESVAVIVTAAFNAATTNVLTVGTSDDSGFDNIVAAGDVNEGAIGNTLVRCPAGVAYRAADTTIKAAYTQTGTAATAGSAIIIVKFIPRIG